MVRNDFYPRPPRGGRPALKLYEGEGKEFLSTPSARRATRAQWAAARCRSISIHALREEGDWASCNVAGHFKNFYPRPPRGGRLAVSSRQLSRWPISIHALREEGDLLIRVLRVSSQEFLSTPSARRATAKKIKRVSKVHLISIHALREEGDLLVPYIPAFYNNFYPRPPRGGRRWVQGQFMLTISISIHALREEGDPHAYRWTDLHCISIHALREEGDDYCKSGFGRYESISIHALREEGDR